MLALTSLFLVIFMEKLKKTIRTKFNLLSGTNKLKKRLPELTVRNRNPAV